MHSPRDGQLWPLDGSVCHRMETAGGDAGCAGRRQKAGRLACQAKDFQLCPIDVSNRLNGLSTGWVCQMWNYVLKGHIQLRRVGYIGVAKGGRNGHRWVIGEGEDWGWWWESWVASRNQSSHPSLLSLNPLCSFASGLLFYHLWKW